MLYSAGSGGNGANYALAGKAATAVTNKAFRAARESAPDYTMLAKTAMDNRSAEKITAMRAEESVTRAGINATSTAKQSEIKARTRNKIDKINNKRRMAGGIAALGKIAGAGYLAFKDNTKGREYPTADTSSIYEKFKSTRDKLIEEHEGKRGTFKPPEFDPKDSSVSTATGSSNSGSTGGTAGKVTSGSAAGASTFDMSALTTKDYDDLAYAISSEAALGTDDEYGVAANILTRLQTGKYGGSVSEIIHAPGQYEGVYKGFSKPSPEISKRLQSPEGQAKIQEFIKRLDGRTEFKGQSMLRNRVAAEDPMFDPRGNFYHYAGQ